MFNIKLNSFIPKRFSSKNNFEGTYAACIQASVLFLLFVVQMMKETSDFGESSQMDPKAESIYFSFVCDSFQAAR